MLNVPLSVSYFCDPNLLLHEAKNDQAFHPGIVKCHHHLRCCVHSGWHLWLPHLWLQCGRRHSLKLLGHQAHSHGGPHRHGCQDLHLLSHIALLWQVWVSFTWAFFWHLFSSGKDWTLCSRTWCWGRKVLRGGKRWERRSYCLSHCLSYWDHIVYPICQVRRVVLATTWFLLTVIFAIQIPNISMVIIVINMSRTHQGELHNYSGDQHAWQSSRCLHLRLPWCLSSADYSRKVFCKIFGQLFPFCNHKQFYPCSSDPDVVTRSSRVRIAGAITFILAGTFLFGVVLTQVKKTQFFIFPLILNLSFWWVSSGTNVSGFGIQYEWQQQVFCLVFNFVVQGNSARWTGLKRHSRETLL